MTILLPDHKKFAVATPFKFFHGSVIGPGHFSGSRRPFRLGRGGPTGAATRYVNFWFGLKKMKNAIFKKFDIVYSSHSSSSLFSIPSLEIFNMSIDPQAVVSSRAKIGVDVEIGPFCVVEPDVVIGDGCLLSSHVTLKRGTILGKGNRLYSGTVIGGDPQHTAAAEPFGRVVIGNNNTLRENVTVHRAMKESEATTIGDDNYLMVNSHLAHDCVVGHHNILVNNVMLAGHVQVGNRVNLGGAVGVHQFCRIGSLAMVGGQAHVIQDVPPFVTVDGLTSRIVGLNQIGLRRNGRSVEEIKTLKEVYRLVFRSGLPWQEILKKLQEEYAIGPGAEMTQFVLGTKRGIVRERRNSARPPLRIIDTENNGEEEDGIRTFRVNVG